jgi:hypothetical protein
LSFIFSGKKTLRPSDPLPLFFRINYPLPHIHGKRGHHVQNERHKDGRPFIRWIDGRGKFLSGSPYCCKRGYAMEDSASIRYPVRRFKAGECASCQSRLHRAWNENFLAEKTAQCRASWIERTRQAPRTRQTPRTSQAHGARQTPRTRQASGKGYKTVASSTSSKTYSTNAKTSTATSAGFETNSDPSTSSNTTA